MLYLLGFSERDKNSGLFMAITIHSVLIINDYKTGGGVLRQGGGGEAEGEGLGIKRMRRRCWAEKKYEG